MTKLATHFLVVHGSHHAAACGNKAPTIKKTSDPSAVTCEQCQRTIAWQTAKKQRRVQA